MKKVLIIVAVVAILSGCGTNETLTCTTDNTVGNITSKTTYVIEYKGNDVKKVMATYDYRDDHIDGVGTGTDGTTEDSDTNDGRRMTDNENTGDNDTTTNRNTGDNATTNKDRDGIIDDSNADTDGIIDGVVGEALDDVVSGIADTVLDLSGIKTRHNERFGTYTNTDGFMTKIDTDNANDYKVTYTYDLTKLSDDDITSFGIDRDLNTLRTNYTNRGMTCK